MKKRILLFAAALLIVTCLFAACNVETCYVTFDFQNGEENLVVPFDSSFQLPTEPTNDDLQFRGWYTDKECTRRWTVPKFLLQDITVYAKWTEKQSETTYCNVIFQPNNGQAAIMVRFDGNFAVPTVTNGNKVFGGWYTDANCTVEWSQPQTLTSDITVYAKWTDAGTVTPTYYNVIFQPNNGSAAITVRFDSSFAVPTVTNGSKVFGGWYTDANCTTPWTQPQTLTSDVTVYAKWTDSGSVTPTPTPASAKELFYQALVTNYQAGTAYKLALYQGTDNKIYYFSGTTESETVTYRLAMTENLSDATDVYLESASGGWRMYFMSGSAKTYIEIYEYQTDKGSVRLTTTPPQSVYKSQTVSDIDLLITTIGSNQFYLGTYNDYHTPQGSAISNLTGENASKIDVTQYPARLVLASVIGGGSSVTPTPTPTPTYYNVIFQPNNGQAAITVKFDSNFAVPTVTNGSKVFGGWYTDASCTTPWSQPQTLTGDVTVYAKWTDTSGSGSSSGFQDNVAYKLVMNQTNAGKTVYIANEVASSYYMKGAETLSESDDVYVENVTNGFYLYFKSGTSKTYLSASVSGTHVNLVAGSAKSVWTYSSSQSCIKTTVTVSGTATEVFIGNYDNYTNFSLSTIDHLSTSFPAQLVLASEAGSGSGGGGTGPSGEFLGWNEGTVSVPAATGLQAEIMKVDGNIGLPSVGTYDCLVVPVQIDNNTISEAQLEKLNKAFNGTSQDTGWESVHTYYQKSSYGKLNMNFNILGYNIGTKGQTYVAKKSSTYYANSTATVNGQKYSNGSDLILVEVVDYLATLDIDISHYDSNGDGCIDAIYLIYSESVDYENVDFWWAYVTWYSGNKTCKNVGVNYYLFAGLDFMDENTNSTLKINAETYIHESGHLLCLDDYYDYYEEYGCNEGLGGADMMDYNIGDHGVYSKIMLGWMEPTIVSSTSTVTINLADSNLNNNCILIRLDNSDTYFSEYLLVDLYSSDGLNALRSDEMYNGANYGVRIYHVSSSINNPYDNDFGSFTDYNNSVTDIALIKLVQADGGVNSDEDEYNSADAQDLWQTGNKLSNVYSNYTNNAGQTVGFDIEIGSFTVSNGVATAVQVTVRFK